MNNYNIETKCVQGGYSAGNGEPRQIPIIQSTTFRYESSADMGKLLTLRLRVIFIHDFRILPMIMWPQKFVKWKAVLPQCLPLQGRRRVFTAFSILLPAATMLFLLLQFMAEPIIFLLLQ